MYTRGRICFAVFAALALHSILLVSFADSKEDCEAFAVYDRLHQKCLEKQITTLGEEFEKEVKRTSVTFGHRSEGQHLISVLIPEIACVQWYFKKCKKYGLLESSYKITSAIFYMVYLSLFFGRLLYLQCFIYKTREHLYEEEKNKTVQDLESIVFNLMTYGRNAPYEIIYEELDKIPEMMVKSARKDQSTQHKGVFRGGQFCRALSTVNEVKESIEALQGDSPGKLTTTENYENMMTNFEKLFRFLLKGCMVPRIPQFDLNHEENKTIIERIIVAGMLEADFEGKNNRYRSIIEVLLQIDAERTAVHPSMSSTNTRRKAPLIHYSRNKKKERQEEEDKKLSTSSSTYMKTTAPMSAADQETTAPTPDSDDSDQENVELEEERKNERYRSLNELLRQMDAERAANASRSST